MTKMIITMTPAGALAQALAEVARRHSFDPNDTPLGVLAPAILAALPEGWVLTKPRWERITDMALDDIREEARQQERERLRAEFAKVPGFGLTSRMAVDELLADPEPEDAVEPPSEALWRDLPRSRWEPDR